MNNKSKKFNSDFNFELFLNLNYKPPLIYSINFIYLYEQSKDITLDNLNDKIKRKEIKILTSEKYACLFDTNDTNKLILLKRSVDFNYYLYVNNKIEEEKTIIVYNNIVYEQLPTIPYILSLILEKDFNNDLFKMLDYILKQKYLELISNKNVDFLLDNVIFIKFIENNLINLDYAYNNNIRTLNIYDVILELRYSDNDTYIKNKICSYFIDNINDDDYYIDYDKLINSEPFIYYFNLIPIKHNILDFLKFLVLKYKIMNI